MNERIIALDIGDARIGVAVSDASRLIATPIDTIYRVGYGPDVRKVVEICQRYDTTQVLSGWPSGFTIPSSSSTTALPRLPPSASPLLCRYSTS